MPAMRPAADSEAALHREVSDRVVAERQRHAEQTTALVGEFRARVFGYLTRCGVPHADRDDLFQEVFLRVHRSDGEPEGARTAPWIMAITVNVVRSHFRKVSVRSVVLLDASPEEGVASNDTGPERALSAKQAVSWLESAMLKLPLEQREALILCAVDGLELADAAEALDVSVDTVKTRLRRARLALVEARARLDVRANREESR